MGSVVVCTVTESVAARATPMVQPSSVTVTAMPAAKAVPATVSTMDVAPGGGQAAVMKASVMMMMMMMIY